jgi:hypothetical protein
LARELHAKDAQKVIDTMVLGLGDHDVDVAWRFVTVTHDVTDPAAIDPKVVRKRKVDDCVRHSS